MASRRVLVTASVAHACCCVPLIFVNQAAAMIALVALLGTGAAFSQATWQALIPRVAGEENIGAAMALQQAAFTFGTILAPAVAGLLAGTFGTGVPLALDAVTFGAMAVAAMGVRGDTARQRRVVRRAGGDHDDRPCQWRAGVRADHHRRGAGPGGGGRGGADVAGHAGVRHRAGRARARPA